MHPIERQPVQEEEEEKDREQSSRSATAARFARFSPWPLSESDAQGVRKELVASASTIVSAKRRRLKQRRPCILSRDESDSIDSDYSRTTSYSEHVANYEGDTEEYRRRGCAAAAAAAAVSVRWWRGCTCTARHRYNLPHKSQLDCQAPEQQHQTSRPVSPPTSKSTTALAKKNKRRKCRWPPPRTATTTTMSVALAATEARAALLLLPTTATVTATTMLKSLPRLPASVALAVLFLYIEPTGLFCPLLVEAKGLVGKLPGNPASCPEEPCTSDPQHVLYALKWTSMAFGLILLLPLLMYYISKLISKIHALCSSKGSAGGSCASGEDDAEMGTNSDSESAAGSPSSIGASSKVTANSKYQQRKGTNATLSTGDSGAPIGSGARNQQYQNQQQQLHQKHSLSAIDQQLKKRQSSPMVSAAANMAAARQSIQLAEQCGALQEQLIRKKSSNLSTSDAAQLAENLKLNQDFAERNCQLAQLLADSSAAMAQQQEADDFNNNDQGVNGGGGVGVGAGGSDECRGDNRQGDDVDDDDDDDDADDGSPDDDDGGGGDAGNDDEQSVLVSDGPSQHQRQQLVRHRYSVYNDQPGAIQLTQQQRQHQQQVAARTKMRQSDGAIKAMTSRHGHSFSKSRPGSSKRAIKVYPAEVQLQPYELSMATDTPSPASVGATSAASGSSGAKNGASADEQASLEGGQSGVVEQYNSSPASAKQAKRRQSKPHFQYPANNQQQQSSSHSPRSQSQQQQWLPSPTVASSSSPMPTSTHSNGHYDFPQRQQNAQISLVSQLYQQQQQHKQNTLALPINAAQHRHSIDGSILNSMVHGMQRGHDQVNSIGSGGGGGGLGGQQMGPLTMVTGGNGNGGGSSSSRQQQQQQQRKGSRASAAKKKQQLYQPQHQPPQMFYYNCAPDQQQEPQQQRQQHHHQHNQQQQQQQRQQRHLEQLQNLQESYQQRLLPASRGADRRPSLNAALMQENRQHL